MAVELEMVELDLLVPWPQNPRLNDGAVDAVAASIRRFGFSAPIVANRRDNMIIAGHTRAKAARAIGLTEVPVRWMDLDHREAEALALADNRLGEIADWDDAKLSQVLQALQADEVGLEDLGFDGDELDELLKSMAGGEPPPRRSLVADFGAPPFSVLDTRQGYWLERRRDWAVLLPDSTDGREAELTFAAHSGEVGAAVQAIGTTSEFDPVLCELLLRWFTPTFGTEAPTVLDPFAGGHVRGSVSSVLGLRYLGHELRPEQIEANVALWSSVREGLQHGPDPVWVQGDSRTTIRESDEPVDYVFSCPPYADLEVYSDRADDLSNMTYSDFIEAYREIIAAAVARLKPNRFACFVVSEVRDPRLGDYRGFVPDTIAAFRDAGMMLWNEAVLINSVGSLRLRAPKTFLASRKLGRSHQNVLVFYKGDQSAIKHEFPDLRETDSGNTEPEPAPEDLPVLRGTDPPVVREHEGHLVVRDDRIFGGTKQRYLERVFANSKARGFIYPTPVWGGAQVALAYAARAFGKEMHLFAAGRKKLAPRQRIAAALGAVIHEVRPGYLSNVNKKAHVFAAEHDGLEIVEWGAPASVQIIADDAGTIELPDGVRDVWCAAGSGTLLRGLMRAWPDRRFHAVVVGAALPADLAADPRVTVYQHPLKYEQRCKTLPPFPACLHYEAKAWETMLKHQAPGVPALLWNVAAHHDDAMAEACEKPEWAFPQAP